MKINCRIYWCLLLACLLIIGQSRDAPIAVKGVHFGVKGGVMGPIVMVATPSSFPFLSIRDRTPQTIKCWHAYQRQKKRKQSNEY